MRYYNERKILCKNIKFIREKCGLSHTEMAEILDIPVLTLKKLESGIITRRARVDIIFRIEELFGISSKDLFTKSLKNIDFSPQIC